VTIKCFYLSSLTMMAPSGYQVLFFSLTGLKRQLVAIMCCVLLVINDKCTQRPLGVVFYSSFTRITHGGHQVHFFLFYGILKQLVVVRSFLSSC